jgi:hypothetical protein
MNDNYDSENLEESSNHDEGDIPEISNSEMTDKELKRKSFNSRKSEAMADRGRPEQKTENYKRNPSPETQMRRSIASPERSYTMRQGISIFIK